MASFERTVAGRLQVRFEAVAHATSLAVRVEVANIGTSALSDVGFAFTPSCDLVSTSDTESLAIRGGGVGSLGFLIARELGSGASTSADLTFAADFGMAKILRLRAVGVAFDGVARALESLDVEVPDDVRVDCRVDSIETLAVGSVARACVSLMSSGRSPAGALSVSLEVPSELTVLPFGTAPERGKKTSRAKAVYLGAGETQAMTFYVGADGVDEGGTRTVRVVVRDDQGIVAESAGSISVLASPDLRLATEVDGVWRVDDEVLVRVELMNAGTAAARDIEIVARGLGGSRPSVKSGLRGTTLLKDGVRVARARVATLRAGEAKKFVLGVKVGSVVGDELPGVSIMAGEAHAIVRSDASYAPEWGSGAFAPIDGLVAPGDVLRIPFSLENSGSETAFDAAVVLDVPDTLEVIGVDDRRVAIDGLRLNLGDVPAGYTVRNALHLKVGALERGQHDLRIGGEVSAQNAYGAELASTVVKASAEPVLEVEALEVLAGVVTVRCANVGDAPARAIAIRSALPEGVWIVERSTQLIVDGSEVTLVDVRGESALVSGGIVLDLLPAAEVRVAAKFVSVDERVASVSFLASFVGEKGTLDQVVVDVPTALDSSRRQFETAGVRVQNPVVVEEIRTTAASVPESGPERVAAESVESAYIVDASDQEVADHLDASVDRGTVVGEHLADDELEAKITSEPEASHEVPGVIAGATPFKVLLNDDLHGALHSPSGSAADGSLVLDRALGDRPLEAAFDHVRAAAETSGPLATIPAAIDLSTTWVKGTLASLSPLIKSDMRQMVLHALVVRLFMPQRFVASVSPDQVEELTVVTDTFARKARVDAVTAISVLVTPRMAEGEAWLHRLENDEIRETARRFAKTVDNTGFRASDMPVRGLWAEVEHSQMRACSARFSSDDPDAALWTMFALFPSRCEDAAVGAALLSYRTLLEAALYNMGDDRLRGPSPVELDDALTSLSDALGQFSISRSAAVAGA